MKRRKSFTLIELIIVLIVLAILAAIAIPIYQNYIEQQKIDICTANQEAISAAITIYEMKYDIIPDSIAKVWRKFGDEALAIVWERKKKEGDYTYLAYISFQKFKYFLANIFSFNTTYAQDLHTLSHIIADKKILKCPMDTRPGATISYGLQPNSGTVADFDAIPTTEGSRAGGQFTDWNQLATRHRIGSEQFAIYATLDGNTYANNIGTTTIFLKLDPNTGKFVALGSGDTEDLIDATGATNCGSSSSEIAANGWKVRLERRHRVQNRTSGGSGP